MGITKGDRVTIYMPRIPETVIAMLACAKIGAIHSVVYGGFSVEALHGRIEDSESKVIVTADGGRMNGKVVELKKIVDEALTRTAAPENVVVIRHLGRDVNMEPGRDFWYHELMTLPLARNAMRCETEVMDAEDPLDVHAGSCAVPGLETGFGHLAVSGSGRRCGQRIGADGQSGRGGFFGVAQTVAGHVAHHL